MNKEKVEEQAIQLIVEIDKNYEKLADCLKDLAGGEQSLAYLDAVYAVIREDAVELNRLSKIYQTLT